MSEFTFPCPLCRQNIQCDEQYRGHQLQCPMCHGEIVAPQAATRPAGPLAVKVPVGDKHTPNIPMLQQKAVVQTKSGMGNLVKVAASIVLVLVILFFMARVTGLDSYFPAFLRKASTETAEGASSASAPGQAASATDVAAAKPAAPPPPPPPPAPVVWTANLANAVIPTNAVHGRINGLDFQYDSARVDNGILLLRQGKDPVPDLEVGVLFGLKPGESLSGKTFDIAQDTRAAQPRVWKKWKVEGKKSLQPKVFSKGYAMKLQFGDVTEDKVPGKIFICLPDEEQSVAAGSFVATVGQAIAASAVATQPATPTQSPMSDAMRKRYGARPGTPR